MQLKVIDENQIKILVETKDAINNNIFYDDINCSDPEINSFITLIVDNVYKQTGIDLSYGNVVIEAVRGPSQSFYINIKRISERNENGYYSSKVEGDMYLFELNELENIFDISKKLLKSKNTEIYSNCLYKYKDRFFLTLEFSSDTVSSEEFYKTLSGLSEFSRKCKWKITNEAILSEWGELICNNVVQQMK